MSGNSTEFERYTAALTKAAEAGVKAAAEVYAIDVRERLSHGYKAGTFSDGQDAASVEVSSVFTEGALPMIRVGSQNRRTFWWEMGHMNHFTRKYERVEHWREALTESRTAMEEAYQEAFNAVMESELG